jgi:hypothetical protein
MASTADDPRALFYPPHKRVILRSLLAGSKKANTTVFFRAYGNWPAGASPYFCGAKKLHADPDELRNGLPEAV